MVELHEAFQAYREGRLDEAERICRGILAALPGEARASSLLCQLLVQSGRAAEAESLAAAGLAANPGNSDLLAQRGLALERLGREDAALACLVEATDRRITNAQAHAALEAILARRRDPSPRFSVSIITATVGGRHLPRALESVQAQQYPFVEHFVVADGSEHHDRVKAVLPDGPRHRVHFLPLPVNIGGGGYCGHRVYGAAPFLVGGRYVAFLDEDNWFEPDHVASLLARITAEGLAWAYALRNIVDANGRFVARDDCESLGQWPTWNAPDVHLVDTNCYMLRRDLALAISPLWYRRYREEGNPDFVICRQLLKDHPRCGTSGRATVNYRAGMTTESVSAEFFLAGNAQMRARYGDAFPWRI